MKVVDWVLFSTVISEWKHFFKGNTNAGDGINKHASFYKYANTLANSFEKSVIVFICLMR